MSVEIFTDGIIACLSNVHSANIDFQVSGRVQEVPANEGQAVKAQMIIILCDNLILSPFISDGNFCGGEFQA